MSIGVVRPLSATGEDPVLAAATFTGNGRVVVKLIPEALLEAETLAQATVGLEPDGARPVGRTRQRAIGFPAWPIITDPANARHALNLVGDLEWARRNAGNQAKKVKERFDALVGDLTRSAPHFVPTLLEELARIYADAGNDAFARQYFGRAREVERAHGIDVDPVRHEAVFLEFADRGIVGAKDLTREAGDAMERFGDPTEAFEYVLRLNCSRIRAGKEPYAHCLRDLRKVGKAAGLSPYEVDARLYDAVVGVAAFDTMPAGLWKAARTSLIQWLREHPERADHYLEAIPAELDVESWLRFLEESGVRERLVADDAAYLAWVRDFLENRQWYRWSQFSPRLLRAIEAQGTGLAGVRVLPEFPSIPIEYLDALAAAGATWTAPTYMADDEFLEWGDWAEQESHTRDLTALLDDPVIGEWARKSISSEFIGENLDALLRIEGGRRIVERRLRDVAEEQSDGRSTLPVVAHRLAEDIRHLTDPEFDEVDSGAVESMLRFDPAESLAANIRAGVLAEMTLPEVEEAARRLAEAQEDESWVHIICSHPRFVVLCGDRFEVVGGGGKAVAGQLPVHADNVTFALAIGDEVAFFHRLSGTWEAHVYWHGGTSEKIPGYLPESDGTSLEIDGGRLTTSGLVSRFDRVTDAPTGTEFAVSADGSRIFASIYGRMREWDRDSGSFRGSAVDAGELPGIIGVGPVPDRATVRFARTYPDFPGSANSPAGVAGGRHYTLAYKIDGEYGAITPLGDFRCARPLDGAIERPGGGRWLTDGIRLIDADTGGLISRHNGILDGMPRSAIHQLRPRSVRVSSAMRAFTADSAGRLLDSLVAEPGRQVDSDEVGGPGIYVPLSDRRRVEMRGAPSINAEAGTAAWKTASELLGTDDPVLLTAVIELAADAAELDRKFRALSDGRDRTESRYAMSKQAMWMLKELSGTTWLQSYDESLPGELALLAEELRSPGSVPAAEAPSTGGVVSLIGHEKTVLALLAAPAMDRGTVREVTGVLRTMVDDGVLCGRWRAHREEGRCACWSWKDGALFAEMTQNHHPEAWWVVAPAEGRDAGDDRMEADEFLAALDALDARDDDVPDFSDRVAALAAGTNLSEGVAAFLIGGVWTRSSTWGSEDEERAKAHRVALGVKAAEFNRARAELEAMPWSLIASMSLAGVAGGDVARMIAEGPDVEAMAQVWRRETGDLGYRMSAAERVALRRTVATHEDRLLTELLVPFRFDSEKPIELDRYVAPLLTLAAFRHRHDPVRPFLRAQFEAIAESASAAGKPPHAAAEVKGELGGDFSEVGEHARFQVRRVLTEGHLDELLADLEIVEPSDGADGGAQGHPMDPLVSAPETVSAVMESLGLGEDAARYFLQVLALATPTDANIREWNGWRKKNIDAAASVLVDKGLLVEAKRAGAGRTRFLSGGWLDSSPGEKGMEVWKAPLYLLWRDTKMRPVVPTCPPLVPVPQLFADAWERYGSGDVPGYEELTTTRYRRR